MQKSTKQNIGFPLIGIGFILIIIGIYSFINPSPVLFSNKENLIFIGLGLLFIVIGPALTWPKDSEIEL